MSRAVCAIAVLICSGCAVTVQNRYSILGFDQWEMLSSERARTFSLLVLSGVAIVSAAMRDEIDVVVDGAGIGDLISVIVSQDDVISRRLHGRSRHLRERIDGGSELRDRRLRARLVLRVGEVAIRHGYRAEPWGQLRQHPQTDRHHIHISESLEKLRQKR